MDTMSAQSKHVGWSLSPTPRCRSRPRLYRSIEERNGKTSEGAQSWPAPETPARLDTRGTNDDNAMEEVELPGFWCRLFPRTLRESIGVWAGLEETCFHSLWVEARFLGRIEEEHGPPRWRRDTQSQGLGRTGGTACVGREMGCEGGAAVPFGRGKGRRWIQAGLQRCSRVMRSPCVAWAITECPGCGRRTSWTGIVGCGHVRLDPASR